jgi:TRAP-type C4-dicarboxylate transport system permease small subunit
MLMVIVIFGALPLVSWRGEHVVFDSLDHLIPPWVKDIQNRLIELICAATFAGLAWLMMQRALRFAEYGDTTVYLQFSIAPVAWLMAGLLLITALVHLLFVFMPDSASDAGEAA